MPEAYNEQNQLVLSLLCITALVASAILYAKIGTSNGYLDDVNDTESPNRSAGPANIRLEGDVGHEDNNVVKIVPKIVIKPPPTCPLQDKYLELASLCDEIIFAKFCCIPQDVTNPAKHKIPKYYYQRHVKNNSSNEAQNTIVNYIIAAVLLTSLGAALFEFYRAKISPSSDVGKKGAKTPLNRKCSLADLTVLKHHRKELVRRESILEHQVADERGINQQQHHQGPKPYPLHRRCSFPASLPSNDMPLGATGFPARRNSRKLSMAGDVSRRLSIVNDGGRKLSIVADEDIWRRGSVVGEDSSPERRVHHSRLVHRH